MAHQWSKVYEYGKSPYHLVKDRHILPSNIQPGDRIAWYVRRWDMLYRAQVARVEQLENGKTRIKAGECRYDAWFCTWHILDDKTDLVYLLGPETNG